MSTNYHTAFGISEDVDIRSLNTRLAALDQAITDAIGSLVLSAALLEERQNTGVDGGSASAATWNQRGNLTEVSDSGLIVSVSTNTFTPDAGTYMIFVDAVANEVSKSRICLYNDTDDETVKEGLDGNSPSSGSSHVASLFYIFTADGSTAYRIDHYTETAKATTGLGAAVGDGSDEVYCQILLIKFG